MAVVEGVSKKIMRPQSKSARLLDAAQPTELDRNLGQVLHRSSVMVRLVELRFLCYIVDK